MNNMETIVHDQRGIILTDNVDLNWINSLTPRYHKEYVKFVVDMKNNKVVIGMDVHADAEAILDCGMEDLYGGNIYPDGHIVYQSTLNVDKNVGPVEKKKGIFDFLFKKDSKPFNPRIITDKETIAYINTVLLEWVIL